MPKRLSDTDKWKKPFIRSLPVEYKLFWLYLLDDCDHAGVWHVDLEVAEIRLGTKLSIQKAQGFFSDKIVVLDNGTKWFIPDFIAFQYGEFNEKNKMYKSIIGVLNKYNLIPHLSSINGGKEKDKVKEPEMDTGGVGGTFLVPEMQKVFVKNNPAYPPSEDLDFHALRAIAEFLSNQLNGTTDFTQGDIMPLWEKISKHISTSFYKSKSLKTIASHIQNIYQETLNPTKHGKGSTNTVTSKNQSALNLLQRTRKLAESYKGGEPDAGT